MRRVLIVEDDADLRGMFRTVLSLAGFHVTEARDGLVALQLLDTEPPPDIVLLDIGLPLVSGHVVRQEIAAQARLQRIPVVIVSASDVSTEGVACVLRKPVLPDKLVRVVERCLAGGEFAEE